MGINKKEKKGIRPIHVNNVWTKKINDVFQIYQNMRKVKMTNTRGSEGER